MVSLVYVIIGLLCIYLIVHLNGTCGGTETCLSNSGSKREFCEADGAIIAYPGYGEGETCDWKQGFEEKMCVNGVPVMYNNCVCHFGYTGSSCDILFDYSNAYSKKQSDGEYSPIADAVAGSHSESEVIKGFEEGYQENLEQLQWKTLSSQKYIVPAARLVEDESQIFEGQFIPVRTIGTKSKLSFASDGQLEKRGNIYRFNYVPHPQGVKSRLELTTCFTTVDDVIGQYHAIPDEIELLTKTSCLVAQRPIDHLHTYRYDVHISSKNFDPNGQCIITQWHGTPDPSILLDNFGCVAQIGTEDLHRICSKGKCDMGKIFDKDGRFTGIRYNQGGYPPLVMMLKNKHFVIAARSDERFFIPKGGCGASALHSATCAQFPRQQHNIIWKMPFEKFHLDQWVKFKWIIKWSEYIAVSNDNNPGIRISDAWIQVWMNDDKIVDWIGPCGRNDNGRIPYFKAGVYNPSGSTVPVEFFFRRFQHHHKPMRGHEDVDVKKMEPKLKIRLHDNESEDINKNALKNLKRYKFVTLPSASKNKCTIRSGLDEGGPKRRKARKNDNG